MMAASNPDADGCGPQNESAHEEVGTLGGLAMAVLDRLPAVGDEVLVDDRVLRVEQLDGRRVAVCATCHRIEASTR